jgi:peptidoglycan/LPS O-acetylase OafA/YrhL
VFVALIFGSGLRIGVGATLCLMAIGLAGFVHISTPWDDAVLPQFLRSGLPAAFFVLAAAVGPALPLKRIVVWGVALGDASYSLYLSHPFVVKPMRAIWAKVVGDHLSPALLIVCSTAASVLFALALFKVVERPLTSYVQKAAGVSRRREEKRLVDARARDAESNR